MKSYRFYGEEMEVLGNRMDQCRKAIASAKSPWAKNYWRQNLERLLFQWRQLPILHDGDAQITLIPRWDIKYDYYETPDEIGSWGLVDRLYDSFFTAVPDLNASWERNRERRLAKAQ